MNSRRVAGVLGRVGTGAISQALSMITNLSVVILAGRGGDSRSFGIFALVYGALQLSVGLTRAVTSDVVGAEFSGDKKAIPPIRRAVLLSAVKRLAAAVVVVASIAIGLERSVTVLGLVLAIAVIPVGFHEVLRQLSFASLQPALALALDAVRLAVSGVLLVGIYLAGSASLVPVVASWLAGALVSAGIGLWFCRSDPRPDTAAWSRALSKHQGAFALEFVLSRGTPEALAWVLAGFGGLSQAGAFRLAQSILGPIAVVLGSAQGTVIAELRKVRLEGRNLLRSTAVASVAMASVAVVYLIVLLLVPSDFGTRVVGELWPEAMGIASYLGIRRALVSSRVAPFLMLRLVGASARSTAIRLVESAVTLVLVAVGGWVWGVTGILVAFVLSGLVSSVIWWSQAIRIGSLSTDEHALGVKGVIG